MKMLKPMTWTADEPIRFQCQDDHCGDIVTSDRIFPHAKEAHQTGLVEMDASIGDWIVPRTMSEATEYKVKPDVILPSLLARGD